MSDLEWIPTADVRTGDHIACLLSDASAYLEVTGWSDRELSRVPGKPVHRTFTVRGAPWWADDAMRTFGLGRETLIVKRGAPVPAVRTSKRGDGES